MRKGARRVCRRGVALVTLIGWIGWGGNAFAQRSAQETGRSLRPAPGLAATLWASEPMVVNPTNIDIDSRGRVWVTEGLNYRLTRAGNQRFQRIEGADKVKILEDTDGDGRADKMIVFADNIFPVPMGIAVEEHWSPDGAYQGARVFIGNSPNLLVLEDTDGDDVADRRHPLLTGFGGVDSDHGIHGMTLGPDGKLYFTHGDGCCSVQQDKSEKPQNFDVVDTSGQRVRTDQLGSVLRCNRDGSQLEILATRLRNDYECAVDSFGNVFASDNDDDGNRGSRIVWIMEGGNYGYRTPGSRLHWGEDVPGIIPKIAGTGNGSPCGVMVYEGDALPELYRGALLEAEAGPRVIFAFPLKHVGAGFRTKAQVMLASDDAWFRPVDVCAAPDGSVYVADWYDAGVGGHAFTDQTTGRIYRLAAEGSQPSAPKYDFASIEGLLKALESPNIATRDLARRLLIARGDEAIQALRGFDPGDRVRQLARVMWVAGDIPGSDMRTSLARAMEQRGERFAAMDPRFREIATRITASGDPLEVEAIASMANDADPGVRRAVLLALREQPTSRVGETLRKLAAAWDGQDRFYLEALGLALREREPDFIKSLFDGNLYGGLDSTGSTQVALPPYFPVDRNEAYLSTDHTLPPATPLSKTLGLMWVLKRAEALPLLIHIQPLLTTPALRQASDDILTHIEDASAAPIVAELAAAQRDLTRRRPILARLADKLRGPWRGKASDPRVVALIETTLDAKETRLEGIQLAAATGGIVYADALERVIQNEQEDPDARAAAVSSFVAIKAAAASDLLDQLVAGARDRRESSPAAEAAVRALPIVGTPPERVEEMMQDEVLPLALRREALRGLAQRRAGAERLLEMARANALPDALRLEAATALRAHPDRDIRGRALDLFPITAAGGQPLPPEGELARREGNPERGRAVFFTTPDAAQAGASQACGSCHRVQGQGQWIGPDLSTIGTKYGKDALLTSILNPSAAIGYNYRALAVALRDGRVLTGLPIEDTSDRLVLKTSDGHRITIKPDEVDERRGSELSLMPEGLSGSMTVDDLVDLLAYLSSLRQPVSIVGIAQAVGPFFEPELGAEARAQVAPDRPLLDQQRKRVPWRRVHANAEGVLDLGESNDPRQVAYLAVSVTSDTEQSARLVVDTLAGVEAFWQGQPLALSDDTPGSTRSAPIALAPGTHLLVLRLRGTGALAAVTTFVCDAPVRFDEIARSAP